MNYKEHVLYKEDIKYIADLELPWEKLKNQSILMSGATGMLGSLLIEVIKHLNSEKSLNCKIYAVGRNKEKAMQRLGRLDGEDNINFIEHDINNPIETDLKKIDYVFHFASATHPKAYASDPIGTITTNILGTKNMLDYAYSHSAKRFVLASSNEIYGENRGDTEFFDEKYCGYIECNTLRAGYPESKRCSEALCQAYIKQNNMDAVIARFTRSYGPSLLDSDTKALSQFLSKAINGEDIVLKSEGKQHYSYTYSADAVAGFLYILLKGENGQAYNIADEKSDITLKELAEIIAEKVGKKVVFDIPDAVEAEGFSKVTKARLSSDKIKSLGWSLKYDIRSGIDRTLEIKAAQVK